MITLTGNTALHIYAQSGIGEEVSGSPSCNGLDWGHGSAKDLLDLEELGISPSPEHTVDILVDHRDHRIQSNKVVNHVCQSKLPPHAVVRLAPGVFIVTPEFCFLEAAKQGAAYAAAIGMECCGAYGRDDSPRGFADRAPISSLTRLSVAVAAAKGHRGRRNALAALRLVLENSRSPLETKTALALTCPETLGGYGLPSPICNYEVVRELGQFGVFQSPRYFIDLCWPNKMVAVECDSYSYHASKDGLDSDSMKRNSLTAVGWRCYSATAAQLTGDQLDVFAHQVANALGAAAARPHPAVRDKLIETLL